MQTPEEFAEGLMEEHLTAFDDDCTCGWSGDPGGAGWQAHVQSVIAAYIRARDAEVAEQVRANDPILRAWVEPGVNPPYHERMKARVRKIMPTLARALDEASKERR